jgi:hypothetical protein
MARLAVVDAERSEMGLDGVGLKVQRHGVGDAPLDYQRGLGRWVEDARWDSRSKCTGNTDLSRSPRTPTGVRWARRGLLTVTGHGVGVGDKSWLDFIVGSSQTLGCFRELETTRPM